MSASGPREESLRLKSFKARPHHLIPVIFVSLLSTGLAAALRLAYGTSASTVWIFPQEGLGFLANALYLVLAVGMAGTLLYFLAKSGYGRALTALVTLAYSAVGFILASVYLPVAFWALGLFGSEFYLLSLAIATSMSVASVVYGGVFGSKRLRLVTMLLAGSSLGALLGFSSTTLTAFTVLLALAAYDVFAVFKGPLGKMVSIRGDRAVKGLMMPFGDLSIGLGDLVFYSMLISHIYLALGVTPFLTGMLGLLLGAYLTFKQLEKRTIFPGLPIALTLAMGLALATYHLLNLLT
ncbi:MAG: hypothetical protein QXJ75_01675 [Candidatus Bathyarchaeia archaeon]